MVYGGWCCHPDSLDAYPTVPAHTCSCIAASYDHRRFLRGGCRSSRASRLSRRRWHGRTGRTSRVHLSHVPGIGGNDATPLTVAAELRGNGWGGRVCDFDAPCRSDDDDHVSTSSIAGADGAGGVHCFSSIISFNTRSRGYARTCSALSRSSRT